MRALSVVLILCGCDLLFPEFAGMPSTTDLAGGDADNGPPHIAGTLCALGDLRDYRSCGGGALSPNLHVTVEETRDAAPADNFGHFTLPLSQTLSTALLAAVDTTGGFTPTVTTVALPGGHADGVAVPLLQANVLSQVALQNGVALDAKKGLFFGWATDGKGTPLSNVVANAPAGAEGPFYDGPQASDIGPGATTSSHGLVVFFNVPPGNASFTVNQKLFTLPVRANAVSLSLLVIAP